MAKTIIEIQAMITDKGDAREIINEIADYLQANPGGGASYLSYVALLTQSGTSAPVATVLENTLGGTPVWSRFGVGAYYVTLVGSFTANKTIIPPFSSWQGTNTVFFPLSSDGNTVVGYYTIYEGLDNDSVFIDVFDTVGGKVDLSTISVNKILFNAQVYP